MKINAMGWFKAESDGVELVRGRPYQIRKDPAISRLISRFHGMLSEVFKPRGWEVTSCHPLIKCNEMDYLAPLVAVYKPLPAGENYPSPNKFSLIVDAIVGTNDERINYGRRLLRRGGLRNHWLINTIDNYIEVVRPGKLPRAFAAEETIPITIDDVVYGEFCFQDIFEVS